MKGGSASRFPEFGKLRLELFNQVFGHFAVPPFGDEEFLEFPDALLEVHPDAVSSRGRHFGVGQGANQIVGSGFFARTTVGDQSIAGDFAGGDELADGAPRGWAIELVRGDRDEVVHVEVLQHGGAQPTGAVVGNLVEGGDLSLIRPELELFKRDRAKNLTVGGFVQVPLVGFVHRREMNSGGRTGLESTPRFGNRGFLPGLSRGSTEGEILEGIPWGGRLPRGPEGKAKESGRFLGRVGEQEALSDLQFLHVFDFVEFLEVRNRDAVLSGDGDEGLSFFHEMLGDMSGWLAGFRR